MVLPLVLIGGYFFVEDAKGDLIQIGEDAAQAGLEAGEYVLSELKDFVSDIDWEAIGSAVGNVAVEVIKAAQEVGSGIFKSVIPDLIEGAEEGYAIIANKLDGKGTQFVGGFTVAFLVVMTMIYIFFEVRRGK
tara:strand:- start:168 stop:566 length:399 start_codon:yes stop_codon:yes gene_type:complete